MATNRSGGKGIRDPSAVGNDRSFLFTLYLLNMHGGEWLPEVFYEDAFLRAFPRVLNDVAPTPYSTPEKTVRSCYTWRPLVNFSAFLGLAEVEPTAKERYNRLYRVKKRPLVAETVRFHISKGRDMAKKKTRRNPVRLFPTVFE